MIEQPKVANMWRWQNDCLHPGHFWFQVSAAGLSHALFLQLVSVHLNLRVLVKAESLPLTRNIWVSATVPPAGDAWFAGVAHTVQTACWVFRLDASVPAWGRWLWTSCRLWISTVVWWGWSTIWAEWRIYITKNILYSANPIYIILLCAYNIGQEVLTFGKINIHAYIYTHIQI